MPIGSGAERNRRTSVSAVALAGALVAGGLAGPSGAGAHPQWPREIVAEQVVKATSPHPGLNMTLLEGPTFGTDPRTVFAGAVEGRPMNPDDLTFDPEGNMYVTVSGDAGGFIYSFDALAKGIRQSNGG